MLVNLRKLDCCLSVSHYYTGNDEINKSNRNTFCLVMGVKGLVFLVDNVFLKQNPEAWNIIVSEY